MEDSRPRSVLVNSLTVCICLLDPRRLTLGTYYMYNRQLTQGSAITANPETVEGMLESLGKLLNEVRNVMLLRICQSIFSNNEDYQDIV